MLFWRNTSSESDYKNGVYELKSIEIGGIKQWLLIRGRNKDNPILLFLHGGPGSAQISIAKHYFSRLEENFLVVNWDQRGAGLSYSRDIPKETMNVKSFVSDAKELIDYLRKTYNKEKIFLVGHSWGSALGVLTANKYPNLIEAYIGVGQVGDMVELERIAYKYVNDYAHKTNNTKAIEELERIGEPPYKDSVKCIKVRSKWTGKFHVRIYRDDMKKLVLRMLTSSEYAFGDVFKLLKGGNYSVDSMWEEVSKLNLEEQVPELKMPVYFITGRHDYTVPFETSLKYFEKLKAPFKENIWFEDSAHCMPFEEPDKFQGTIIDKLSSVLKQC